LHATIISPDSSTNGCRLPSNAAPSDLLIRVLPDVCRDYRGNQSDPEATNHSPDVKLSEVGGAEGTKSLHE
jgi:hypothetical protein